MRFLAPLQHWKGQLPEPELTGDSFCRWRKGTAGQGASFQCHLILTSTPPTYACSHQGVPWPCKLLWVICLVPSKCFFINCLIWRWITHPHWAFGGLDIDALEDAVCLKGDLSEEIYSSEQKEKTISLRYFPSFYFSPLLLEWGCNTKQKIFWESTNLLGGQLGAWQLGFQVQT